MEAGEKERLLTLVQTEIDKQSKILTMRLLSEVNAAHHRGRIAALLEVREKLKHLKVKKPKRKVTDA